MCGQLMLNKMNLGGYGIFFFIAMDINQNCIELCQNHIQTDLPVSKKCKKNLHTLFVFQNFKQNF